MPLGVSFVEFIERGLSFVDFARFYKCVNLRKRAFAFACGGVLVFAIFGQIVIRGNNFGEFFGGFVTRLAL